MDKILSVRPLPDYRLELVFSDGVKGIVSLKNELHGRIYEPLQDPELFAQAYVDEFGALAWPNGADYAPDALYIKIAPMEIA